MRGRFFEGLRGCLSRGQGRIGKEVCRRGYAKWGNLKSRSSWFSCSDTISKGVGESDKEQRKVESEEKEIDIYLKERDTTPLSDIKYRAGVYKNNEHRDEDRRCIV